MKVPIFGGFPVENPTNKATAPKLFQGNFFVRVRFGGVPSTAEKVVRVGFVAYLVERPTRETQAEQYSDNALMKYWARISGDPTFLGLDACRTKLPPVFFV